MIVLSNSTVQTLNPGQSIIFDITKLHSGNGECHRDASANVKLKAGCAVYSVHFSGNITGATENVQLQLSVAVDAGPLTETTMIYTPAAANAYGNVSTATGLRTCCGGGEVISVTNSGTTPVIVGPNTSLFISRRA